MFRIDQTGPMPGQPRLVANDVLTREDYDVIAAALGTPIFFARKTGLIRARKANAFEQIDTLWNGRESRDIAVPGDFIVTNLSADKDVLRDASGQANIYVVRADAFSSLYEPATDFKADFIYRSRGKVDALFIAGGFDIAAPWGERQVGSVGYLLRNGSDIYGNHKDTFEATYERDT